MTEHVAEPNAPRRAEPARPAPTKEGGLDKQKVMREVRGWVVTIVAVLAFRTFLYEAVYIPSGSMIPTLQIGDYVIVEKWAYGARLPFTDSAQATWLPETRGRSPSRQRANEQRNPLVKWNPISSARPTA